MSSAVKLIASTGMNAVLQELLPIYEAQTGNSIILSCNSSNLIMERLDSGETADVILLTRDALEALAVREFVMA